ncbi:MAG: DUF3108 domain-containing protein [Candidatus Omnitrophota bacterium]
MKKIIFLFVITAVICFVIATVNNDPAAAIYALLKKGPIKEGNLVYRIYAFGFIPIGNAKINKAAAEIYNGNSVYHLSAAAKSANYLSRIFNATGQLDSYIDAQTHNPIAYRQRVSIANKDWAVKEIAYDQQNATMTIAGVKRQILPNTQDSLSAIYNIRLIDLNKVRDFEVFLNTNQKNYLMKGSVSAQTVTAGNKIFKIAVANAEIKRYDGNPHHKSKISIIMLKDHANIPALIKVFASGAMISAKLIEIE